MANVNSILHSKKSVLGFAGIMFAFMLMLNFMTPYIADDFTYRLSFYTSQPLSGLIDVARSMYVHCFIMNGRVVSHSLEQIFMLMPKGVFNLCNAAVYTAVMYLMYRTVNFGKKHSVLLFVAVGAAFWKFTPSYGQVVLWQVGALNYLWGLLAGLLLMIHYIYRFIYGKDLLKKTWTKVLFTFGAFFIGMYTEVTSFIAILLSLILLVLRLWMHRESIKTWLWVPLVTGSMGFLGMMLMPAESAAKQGSLTLPYLLRNFTAETDILATTFIQIVTAWVVLFVLSILLKCAKERLILSGVFVFGAVSANYMMMVASYYPQRCMCTTAMLSIMACGVLIPALLETKAVPVCACGGAMLGVLFIFQLVPGCFDIMTCYTSFTAREYVIEQAIAAGEKELVLQCVHPITKYSGFYGVKDLDTESAQDWPNNAMAVYYGVSGIVGY